jgi:hypothetical protein
MPERATAAQAGILAEDLDIVLAEYRLPAQFRHPLVGRLLLLLPVTAALLGAGYAVPGYGGLTVPGWFLAPFAAGNLILYAWRGRFMTQVTTAGIRTRGYFSHFVPWAEVAALEVRRPARQLGLGEEFRPSDLSYMYGDRVPARTAYEGRPGRQRARLATVSVIRPNGRKLMLRAPLVAGWAPDPLFTEKVTELNQLWRWFAGAAG